MWSPSSPRAFQTVEVRSWTATELENTLESNPSIERRPTVLQRLGVGKSTLYTLIRRGLFKPPLKLGGRAVGWLSSDVTEFILARAQERNHQVQA
jgi:prophage regulatory protein